MMRFLRKGDCYALNKPIKKYYYQLLYSFKCLLLSVSAYCYQFSCNVQESRASGTTGYAVDRDNRGREVIKERQLRIARSYVRISAAVLLTIFCVLFSFASVVEAQAQELRQGGATSQAAIKPLQIGDTIPEEIWNMPLQVVEYGGKTKEIRLADYRGKVIILDYWATWCGSCILSMPKMHELAEGFHDDVVLLPVTHESVDVVRNFLDITSSRQILSIADLFHTVTSGAALKDLIPHQTLPHIGIINREGVLGQVTKPLYLNEEVLGQVVRKQDYYMPTYLASLDTTLLSLTYSGVRQYRDIYYTTVMGYVDGFMFPYEETRDTVAGIQKGHFINRPILQLFNNARPIGLALLPNRRLIIADNPLALEYHHMRNPNYSHQQLSYSYEYVVPLAMDKTTIRQRMWDDLNNLTGYHAQIVQREIPCIVLKNATGRRKISPSKDPSSMMYVLNGISQERTPREVGRSEEGFLNYMHGVTIKGMVSNLNKMGNGVLPFFIDETGIDHRIDIGFPDNITDSEAFVQILSSQGIDAAVENRVMDMFVISDRPIDRVEVMQVPIKLTEIGYLPAEDGHE